MDKKDNHTKFVETGTLAKWGAVYHLQYSTIVNSTRTEHMVLLYTDYYKEYMVLFYRVCGTILYGK